MKKKFLIYFEIFYLIAAITAAILIYIFGIIPVKNYVTYNVEFHLKSIKLNKNIRALKKNVEEIEDLSLVYNINKLKKIDYNRSFIKLHSAKNGKVYNNNKLNFYIDKIKLNFRKINTNYKNIALFISKTRHHNADYDARIISSLNKSYFDWKNIDAPLVLRLLKYHKIISHKLSYGFLSKLSSGLSSLILPSIPLIKYALKRFKNIFYIYIYIFIFMTVFAIITGMIFINYVTKYFENLKNSNNIFQSIFKDNSAIMILIDENGKIIDVNDAAVYFYGYGKEKFKTMYNYEFNATPKSELMKYTKQAFNKEKNYFTFTHKTAKGELKNVEVHISPIYVNNKNYIISIIQDITERKLAENKLKESEELFKSLSTNLTSGLILYDKEKIIYANPIASETFGYKVNELIGLNPFFLIYNDEIEQNKMRKEFYKQIYQSSASNNKYVVKGRKNDGSLIWLLWQTAAIKYNDINTMLATFFDITEMINLKNQLEKDKELLKVLVENINSGIALYTKDKFIYVNSALLDMFNYTKEEFLNLNVIDFFSIDESMIYNPKSPIFKTYFNNELSSRFIYKYNDNKDDNKKSEAVGKIIDNNKIRYIDLFRTAIIYNYEQTGLAIFLDVTDRVLKEEHILIEKETYKELSEIDGLTKTHNRRSFDNKLTELLNIAGRYNRPLSLTMFDIDKFKEINDTFGHEIGDYILKEITGIIKQNLRNTDFFARYGGDEFMILYPETAMGTAIDLTERLRLKIESNNFNIETVVTCSFGITEAKKGDTNQSIAYRADNAMYDAKNAGGNKVAYIK
jgi:diguanylate cyclase (GGDEF)-like protein/PAS domain S-box-containing protein